MEFNFSFKTSKKGEVNKAFTRDPNPSKHVADDFYTSIVNLGSIKNNLDLLLYFFNNVSEINAIITYIAQKGADIPVKHVRILNNKKQKDLGNTDYLKLLKKPNHINGGKQFTVNSLSSYFVFGYIPINKIKSVGWDIPQELFLLPASQFYPIPEKCIDQYGTPSYGADFRFNKIIKYRYFVDSKPYNLLPEEVIIINDSNLSFADGAYLKGQSRLYSAIRSIKTLDYVYDTVNTLLANKGAAGFLTRRAKPNEQDPQWWSSSEDRKEVEKKLYEYGTTGGRRPIGTSNADLGFVRLSVPVNEFMPIELKQHEFRTLATALIFPSVLLNDKEGSIYNNVSLAQKAFYTDCLQPLVNTYYETLSEGLGLTAMNEALVPDWSGIECLQTDKKLQAETNKVWNEVFQTLWDQNMITRNQWLSMLGLPEISKPEYNKLKNELNENENTQGTD